MEEVIDAEKRANVHDFITELPNQYRTFLTDKSDYKEGKSKESQSQELA